MLAAIINRFMMIIYKNKSSTDAAQVPTSSTIQLFRVGANLTASFSLAPDTDSDTIAIDDPGQLKFGDTVKVFSGGALHDPGLYVEAVTANTISLANTSSTLTASGAAGDRLVITNGALTVYPTQAATSGTGVTSISSDATTGVAQGYVHEKRFDAVVTISGSPTKVIADDQSIPVYSPLPLVVNAAEFASLGDAIAAVPTGGTLFIPAADYTVPNGGLIVSRSLAIQGEPGTRLIANSAGTNQPVIKITPGGVELTAVALRDLKLINPTVPTAPISGNYGVQCDVPSDGSKVSALTLERVNIVNMGDDGIHLHALGGSDSFFVFVTLRDVYCTTNWGRGLFASYANLLNCYGCYFNGNQLDGARADLCEVAFYACAFENNCKASDMSLIDGTFDGQVYLRGCAMSRLDGCHFENFTGSGHLVNKRAVMIENSSCTVVSGCAFFNAGEDSSDSERGIYCTWGGGFQTPAPGVTACAIFPNSFTNVHVAVEIDAGDGAAQDCVVFPQRIIGTTSSVPVKLPTALSDSGIVALGNRKLGTGGLARGIFVPPLQETAGALPLITGSPAGYMLFDTTLGTLRIWDGRNPGKWLTVQVT